LFIRVSLLKEINKSLNLSPEEKTSISSVSSIQDIGFGSFQSPRDVYSVSLESYISFSLPQPSFALHQKNYEKLIATFLKRRLRRYYFDRFITGSEDVEEDELDLEVERGFRKELFKFNELFQSITEGKVEVSDTFYFGPEVSPFVSLIFSELDIDDLNIMLEIHKSRFV
jgi:hypothetical protein